MKVKPKEENFGNAGKKLCFVVLFANQNASFCTELAHYFSR